MEHALLVGAEEVRSAASSMRSAAEEMNRAASSFYNTASEQRQFMDRWLAEFRAIVEAMPK
mgnify:CR=1 FL=1